MKILFFGDIFGRPGRTAVKKYIEANKASLGIDLIIANGDNVASGRGPTNKTYEEMIGAGVDVLTCGDHIWDQSEIVDALQDKNSKLIRPENYPDVNPGRGSIEVMVGSSEVLVADLLGRVFTSEGLESPFVKADEILQGTKAKITIFDFHAEATSEKMAMGHYLAGKVSAVLGTHTHVQTADEKIIDGTAYISDVGFCGPVDSIIGVEKSLSIRRFLTGVPIKFEVAEGPAQVNAVIVTIDEKSGRAESIERISEIVD
jgi:hypothetical protein